MAGSVARQIPEDDSAPGYHPLTESSSCSEGGRGRDRTHKKLVTAELPNTINTMVSDCMNYQFINTSFILDVSDNTAPPRPTK